MDRRSLPISMRPHLCRVQPQAQRVYEPEIELIPEAAPKPKPEKKGKSKKEMIVSHTSDSSIREEVIPLLRKRNG